MYKATRILPLKLYTFESVFCSIEKNVIQNMWIYSNIKRDCFNGISKEVIKF